MRNEKRIDYVEIPVTDLAATRKFFEAMFDWTFEMWGDDYMSFNDGSLDGGFCLADTPAPATGVLLIFYSNDLERDRARVLEHGASISQDIFEFPGGRRFQFVDPAGTEYAIWSAPSEPSNGES